MGEPVVWVRAVHFAATISVAGVVLFVVLLAEPAFRKADDRGEVSARVRPWLSAIEWVSLALVVVSGAAWLVIQSAQMGDVPWSEAVSEGLVQTVLLGTGFPIRCDKENCRHRPQGTLATSGSELRGAADRSQKNQQGATRACRGAHARPVQCQRLVDLNSRQAFGQAIACLRRQPPVSSSPPPWLDCLDLTRYRLIDCAFD